jgi:hypothetical protein
MTLTDNDDHTTPLSDHNISWSYIKMTFYLKYPDNAIRKLICQFRVSDHSLGIEKGR